MEWGRHNRFSLETASARFWERTRREGECLVWTGAIGSHGRYGILSLAGRQWLAHRAAWFLASGVDPAENVVCHRCDNGLCVNLEHLFIGTQGDNVADMEQKRRSRHPKGQDHGRAKLTADQVADIRVKHASGQSRNSLAREYGVAAPTIGRIVSGTGWITT